jgi:hypothetical protein
MTKTTFTIDEVQNICKRTFELTRELSDLDRGDEWFAIKNEIEEEADGDMTEDEINRLTDEEWAEGQLTILGYSKFEGVWQTLVSEDLIG